ncbi:MAG: hypothetical protein ACOCUS_05540, partial [Polyangiales bacterium]
LDSSGTVRWAEAFGSIGNDAGYGLAFGAEHLFVTGHFKSPDSVDFGDSSYMSHGEEDMFLVALR